MKDINCIFIVEDSEVDTWIALKVLEFAKISKTVISANESKDAIFKLKSFSEKEHSLPEIILVDLSLPLVDGCELISRIKKLPHFDPRHTQLILITEDLDDDVDLIKMQKNDVRYVIFKPLNKEKLEEAMALFEKENH